MSNEAEMIGIKVGLDQLQVICNRYYFAGLFVKDKRVLEVGCGSGIGLDYLAQRAESVVGGDSSYDNLKVAKEYTDSPLIQFDAHALPFQDKSFDVVVALATIIYLDLDRFFTECHRVLKSKGILVFCTPNKNQPHFQPSKESKNYYSVPELSQLVSCYFYSDFFGMFPISAAQKTMLQYKNNLMALFGKTIPRTFKNYLYPMTVLEPSVFQTCKHLEPEPIETNKPDYIHRVIYAKCDLWEDK